MERNTHEGDDRMIKRCRSLHIELTDDNEIIRILAYGKEITHYSIEYIDEEEEE